MRRWIFGFLFVAQALQATPTSLFWTNCTTDVQAPNTLHLNVNKNVKLRKKSRCSAPLDIGLLGGLYGNEYCNIEAGADYQYHIAHPVSGNAKIKFLPNSAYPFSLGVYNVGVHPVVNAVLGTSFDEWGKVYIGIYRSKKQWGNQSTGYMLGYQKFFHEVKSDSGDFYKKWLFSVDYASGKNSVSGFGVALSYYFTPQVNLQTGPVCFRNRRLQQIWQWSFQLGIDY